MSREAGEILWLEAKVGTASLWSAAVREKIRIQTSFSGCLREREKEREREDRRTDNKKERERDITERVPIFSPVIVALGHVNSRKSRPPSRVHGLNSNYSLTEIQCICESACVCDVVCVCVGGGGYVCVCARGGWLGVSVWGDSIPLGAEGRKI